MTDLYSLFGQFDTEGTAVSIQPFGNGHINKTYVVETDRGVKYILQSINPYVFPDTEGVMNNIFLVTSFLQAKIRESGGDPDRETLNVILTRDGDLYTEDEDGTPYRVYTLVPDTFSYQIVDCPEHFYSSALAFGGFTELLSDFPADRLVETIRDFHNTKARFAQLREAIAKNESGRAEQVSEEIGFALAREEFCGKIVDAIADGSIPLRVTHNDTKLNNVLIDKASGKAICVCDLDTVMPGSVLYDFGDAIRFGTNTAAEDEKDLSLVSCDLSLFEAYVKGTMEVLGKSMNEAEIDLLVDSAIILTMECGIRFLADHINGDKYFSIHREGHNLDRARTQFRLAADMEAKADRLRAIVDRYR